MVSKPHQARAQNDYLVEIWRKRSPDYEDRARGIIQDAMKRTKASSRMKRC